MPPLVLSSLQVAKLAQPLEHSFFRRAAVLAYLSPSAKPLDVQSHLSRRGTRMSDDSNEKSTADWGRTSVASHLVFQWLLKVRR